MRRQVASNRRPQLGQTGARAILGFAVTQGLDSRGLDVIRGIEIGFPSGKAEHLVSRRGHSLGLARYRKRDRWRNPTNRLIQLHYSVSLSVARFVRRRARTRLPSPPFVPPRILFRILP